MKKQKTHLYVKVNSFDKENIFKVHSLVYKSIERLAFLIYREMNRRSFNHIDSTFNDVDTEPVIGLLIQDFTCLIFE